MMLLRRAFFLHGCGKLAFTESDRRYVRCGSGRGIVPVRRDAAGCFYIESEGSRMENRLQVGAVTTTHGLAGEVKVFPTTDDAKRFKKLKDVLLDTGKELLPLEVEHVKFFKNMVILKFRGYDRIEDVMGFKGKNLYVTRENAVKLNKDEYFIADLIGMKVYTEEDAYLGELTEVITTAANDVYTVRMEDGREVLIPAIGQCILEVDVEQAVMKVHLLEGLLE